MGSSKIVQFLVLGLVCSCNFLGVNSFGFNLPNVDEIKSLFGSMADRLKSAERSNDELSSDDIPHERLKRQASNIGDESPLPHEVTSSTLPMNADGQTINTRYMPTLGNGYLGLTVYDDHMFLNGVFSGTGGESHRAKIPALLMTKVSLLNQDIERRATRKYTLNAMEGFFMEKVDCEYATIYHKIYLHQKFIRLLVVDTFAVLKPGVNGGLTIVLKYPSENSTDDITWQGKVPYLGGSWQHSGVTKSSEAGEKTQNVYIFTNDPLVQIQVSGSNWIVNVTQVMAVDRVAANARQEFDAAQKILQQPRDNNPNWQFFQEHANAWRSTWANGLLEVNGNDKQLNKAVWFAQYYLMSSLPAQNPFLPPLFNDIFFGLGRTGLGKGSLGKDYQGHVMYDNEFYMLPAVLPFHPFVAKAMLRYRSALAKNAAANAKRFNNGIGYHYPWESGTSGADVTSDSCPAAKPNCYWNRLFVTAGVSYAIRMYYSTTRDRDYMVNTIYSGCDVSREIAKFLAGQAIYKPENGRYVMNDITGPDDSHPHINNNAFTLAASSLAIHYARYFSCLCQRNERDEIPDEYIQKALYLDMPFDNVKRLHNQFEGFDPAKDIPIKQADAIMLNYPLNWNYSVDIMKNDLMFYETLMSDRTPAMTWSWFTIGWKWVNEISKMRTYFLKSYQDYVIQPFKIWTEYTERNPSDQMAGNVNFLPGMGAFLQSIIYGFAGFRIRPDKLEVHNPIPPPGANNIVLTNFYYLGSNITFTITAEKTTIRVLASSPLYPLLLLRNTTGAVEETLKAGATVTVDKATSNGFFIYTTISETCEHPRDYIYMPWGYSPWINAAPDIHCSMLHVAIATVASLITILLTVR